MQKFNKKDYFTNKIFSNWQRQWHYIPCFIGKVRLKSLNFFGARPNGNRLRRQSINFNQKP